MAPPTEYLCERYRLANTVMHRYTTGGGTVGCQWTIRSQRYPAAWRLAPGAKIVRSDGQYLVELLFRQHCTQSRKQCPFVVCN